MAKSERFEMRLEEDLGHRIDDWRDTNMAGSSRAQTIRVLIERGLESGTGSSPRFSDGEKTLMALLRPVLAHLGASTSSLDAILAGFRSGHHWTADQQFTALYTQGRTSKEDGDFVLETLEMWDVFEQAYEELDAAGREIVLAETAGETAMRESGTAPPSREVKFLGFYERRERDLGEIAAFLVNELQYFPRFAGRSMLDAPDITLRDTAKKLEFYRSVKPSIAGKRSLSPQQIREFTLTRYGTPWPEVQALLGIG